MAAENDGVQKESLFPRDNIQGGKFQAAGVELKPGWLMILRNMSH